MKKILIALLLAFLPLSASAAVTFPINGGSGNAGTLTGWLYGNGTSPYTASTSPFFDSFSFRLATGTSATTTNFFSTTASSTNLFSTIITSPLYVGGTGIASSLTLKSTSGVGASDFIKFLVGNNGATEAMRILTSGNVGIGTASPSALFSVGASSQFQVSSAGAITSSERLTLTGAGNAGNIDLTGKIFFHNSSAVTAPTDGTILLANNALTGFTRQIFGTNDASGISIKKNGTEFDLRTGDDSANANLVLGNSTTTNATTTTISATTASTTNQFVSSLGTAAGTFVAANPSGQLIATTSPSSGTTINTSKSLLPTAQAPINPSTANGDVITNVTINTNTAMSVGRVEVKTPISVNRIIFTDNGITTPGSVKIGLYSEDGQTLYISTSTAITTSGVQNATTTAATLLNPGIYYIGIVPVSTTNFACTMWKTKSYTLVSAATAGLGGLPVYEGTITVTAGTLPSTITPSAITYGTNNTLFFRLEN